MEHIKIQNFEDQIVLKNLINDKQANEQEMAVALLNAFNSHEAFMGILRALVSNAIDDIRWFINNIGHRACIRAFKKDAVNYKWLANKYRIGDPKEKTFTQRSNKLSWNWISFHQEFIAKDDISKINEFNAEQCADFIRFYGEVIEAIQYEAVGFQKKNKTATKHHGYAKELVKRSKEYQIQENYAGGEGPQWDKRKERGRFRGLIGIQKGLEIDNFFYSDLKPPIHPRLAHFLKKHQGKRDYSKVNTSTRFPKHPMKDVSKKAVDEYNKELREYNAKLREFNQRKKLLEKHRRKRTSTELKLAKLRGGISLWVQTEKDRVAKLDKVFGLAHGATISGTTTDNIFFFNRFSMVDRYLGQDITHLKNKEYDDLLKKYFELETLGKGKYIEQRRKILKQNKPEVNRRNTIIDPIFYMLPLAAIVAGGHHTTIECALPLVLNGIINYNIGEYETLFPVDRKGRNACGDMSAIKNILRKHQKDRRNVRIVIYYKSEKPEGYFKFDPNQDRNIWNPISEVSQKMSDSFSGFAEYPTKNNIRRLSYIFRKHLDHSLFEV